MPDVKALTAEIGRSGLAQYGGRIVDEYDPDLRMPNAARIYDEMRKADPTVAVGLRIINWFIGRITWAVEPGGDTPADQDAATFLESCLTDMSETWSKFIRDILTCLPFGFAYLETVYKLRNGGDADPASQHDDGRVGWRKFVLLGQDTLSRWDFDETGGTQAFVQVGDLIGGVYLPERAIPIDKALLFRLDDEKNNPEGVSLLRSVYLPWYSKKQIQEIEAIGIERDLTGVLIIHLPESATAADQSKAQQLLEQFKADDMAGFTAPQFGPGDHQRWRFEIINSPGSKSIDPDKAIQRYQLEIARSFLAQFLMLGQNSGSRALSDDQSEVFAVAIGAIVLNIEETLNRFAVPPLFKFNDFGQLTALPRIKAGRVSKSDSGKFATALQSLAAGGFLTPDDALEAYIREELELPARMEQTPESSPTLDTGDKQAVKLGEGDPDEGETVWPDVNDDDTWERLQRESDKRIEKAGRRSAGEILQFAKRPFDYTKRRDAIQGESRRNLIEIGARLREGTISPAEWGRSVRTELLASTIDGYKIGLAETRGVVPSRIRFNLYHREQINKLLSEQDKYLKQFSADIKAQIIEGKEFTTALDNRTGLYSGTVRSATSRAQLDEEDRSLRWIRFAGDSCETCLKYGGQVKTATQWAKLDVRPAHNVACHGNCRCHFQAVEGKR